MDRRILLLVLAVLLAAVMVPALSAESHAADGDSAGTGGSSDTSEEPDFDPSTVKTASGSCGGAT